jgi:hypothetical protein
MSRGVPMRISKKRSMTLAFTRLPMSRKSLCRQRSEKTGRHLQHHITITIAKSHWRMQKAAKTTSNHTRRSNRKQSQNKPDLSVKATAIVV